MVARNLSRPVESATDVGRRLYRTQAAKAVAATAGTAAGTATTGVGGVLIGAAAGEAVGIAMDKKDVKNSTRNRMIQLFVAKLRQDRSTTRRTQERESAQETYPVRWKVPQM